jgi:hypothetical protein
MHSTKDLLSKIQARQNYCARLLSDHASSVEALKTLKWLNLENRRKLHLGTLMYKVVNGQAPIYLANGFSEAAYRYNLRSSIIVTLPISNSNPFFKKTFAYAGTQLWNSIQRNVKLETNVQRFKRNFVKELEKL